MSEANPLELLVMNNGVIDMVETVVIKEVEDNHERFKSGIGELDLYENMPDELIAKIIRRAFFMN